MEGVDVVSETWHFSGEGLVPVDVETFDDVQALAASTKAMAGHHRARRSRKRGAFIGSTEKPRFYIEHLRSGCNSIGKVGNTNYRNSTVLIVHSLAAFSKVNLQWRDTTWGVLLPTLGIYLE